jgi:hypothetical protein
LQEKKNNYRQRGTDDKRNTSAEIPFFGNTAGYKPKNSDRKINAENMGS